MAGGAGSRFGRPKQFEKIGEERVLDRSRRVAAAVSDGVVVVVPAEDAAREGGVAGGPSRAASVRAGLAHVPEDCDVVCVHDAARPLAPAALYRRVIAAIVDRDGVDGAVPGLAVTDTIKRVDDEGFVVDTPERDGLVAVQTPQAFRAEALRSAHRGDPEGSDDSVLVERAGGRVVVVRGEPANRKITHVDDLAWVRAVVAAELEIGGDAGAEAS